MSNLSTLFDRYKALVVFDTETSGLDFDNDQIIELAALRVERTATGGLRIAGKMDTFIKLPEGETLPENIVSLTGITDERLQTEGVQPVKAAGQIAKLMQNGPTLMIAHNFLRGLLRGQKVGRIDWLDSLTVYKDRRAYPHKLANAIIAYDLTGKVQNSMSPEITITSEELRERVEDRLDRWIPDDVWNRAEPYARHKNEVNRQRHPEIDYYDNDYLVLLTADTVRETEFSDLTHALCDLTVARAQ